MSHTETHTIVLTKISERQLRDKVIAKQLSAILAAINSKTLTIRGWSLAEQPQESSPLGNAWTQRKPTDTELEANPNASYVFSMFVTVTFSRDDGKTPDTYELDSIIRTLSRKARTPAFGSWVVTKHNDKPYTEPENGDASDDINRDMIGYADVVMPDDDEWDSNFSHLYGLDDQIARVRSALLAGAGSNWRNRFHAALIGPPGCGKSDIGESVRQALGEDAVMKLDATATTAAGAIKELSERDILPRVIIIEEIEKAPEAAMSFLLGVLDQRSEIRKTTARGTIQRDTKLYAIATVNDVKLFRQLQAKALASRFPNKIFFKRPSRDTLALILAREVSKVEGSTAWISPTLDYCEQHDITDPREVISLCLCGGDLWLDVDKNGVSEYARMLDATSEAESDE